MVFNFLNNIDFAEPQFFLLGLLLPVLIVWYIWRNSGTQAGIKVSSIKSFRGLTSWKNAFRHLPFILRLLSIACIIAALARPQTKTDEQQAEGDGVDIVLCIDVSGSMTAQDFTPNRMEAAKKVAQNFIDSRLTDRIAIVIFSGESFTQFPVSSDHAALLEQIRGIRSGMLMDGTVIGEGLGML